mgnify:CR=1 FL=1
MEIVRPSVINTDNTDVLRNHIDAILCGQENGLVFSSDVFGRSIDYAERLGLSGGVNSTTMPFNYDDSSEGFNDSDRPSHEDWESLGVTPLHADGAEGDRILSISKCHSGAYSIYIANRGPAIIDQSPVELWDSLHEDTVNILARGTVNTENLDSKITRLDIAMGQTAIFNPSRPHMGVTRQAPRRVDTTFYTDKRQ